MGNNSSRGSGTQQPRPHTCTVVGYDAFLRVQVDRASFFTRLAETAKRADVPNAVTSVVVARNFKLVRKIAHGCNGIVYEVKCIGDGHPEFFRDQSYVLKVPFNYWGVRTSSVANAFENEYLVSSTLDAHPNVNQYFCHFTDRPPQEYYDLLPQVPKELALDSARKRIHACVWIVLEYHSETLEHFLKNLNNPTGTQQPLTTMPWCVVHKYLRDICAGLVHLFKNRTIHFDIKLDNIVVSSNKEQAIVIDLGCAKKFPNGSLERETGCFIGTVGNMSHLAPEILNGIALYTQHPDRCPILPCEKQPSFELGCILFELAMCGQHPLPGYPAAYGPSGQVAFSVQREEFPLRPPAYPRAFCNLVCGLLEYDPAKRIPLLEASKLLETLGPDPSPQEQLSFYTLLEPFANNDPGTLTANALCQILSGNATKDCVDTLHRALDIEPLFSPALLILHYLLASGASSVHEGGVTRKGIRAAVSGKALFTHSDVEFERAINQMHRTTLPELVLSALRMRHLCNIGCDDNNKAIKNCLGLLQGKVSSVGSTRHGPAPSSDQKKTASKECGVTSSLSAHVSIGAYLALFEFEEINIETAIHLVSEALRHFESGHTNKGRSVSHEQIPVQEELCYLPGLLFLHGLCFFADDHIALHQLIPPNLSTIFSRAISGSLSEMRDYCQRVLLTANCATTPLLSQTQHEEKAEETMLSITQEWDALMYAISAFPKRQKHGACEYFVALWTCCLEKPSCGLLQRVGCMTHKEPTTLCSATMSLIGAYLLDGAACMDRDPSKAVSLFQKAADAGNASAMFNLGLCYYNGDGVDKDINKAVSLYKRAADAGNTNAMTNLGVCCDNGNGVDKDMNQAVSLYWRAADAGNTNAMFNLGVRYDNSGVDKDINQAVSLYWRAADAGNASAMNNLGWCYKNGDGVDKDMNQAVSLFQKAADAGNADAMFNLGVCYYNGDGVDQDMNQAVSLYRRATDAGNTNAMNNLGLCYKNGDGVDRDLNQAVSLYRRAADAGNTNAVLNLGACYYNGEGVNKDINQAVSLYKRAADAGNANAMNTLGWCYNSGDGVDKDMNQAVSLYKRAADAGNAEAMFNLGVCYKNGNGVDKDMNQAVSLFRRAVYAGNTKALFNLGVGYETGNGVGVAETHYQAATGGL
ncbi:sel1 repeat family protein [Pelomyxa schiedti]|nr:sel1 repeat family protein [Pelomyxa schiedti]